MRDALQAAEEAAAIAECDLVAARRCLEKADKLREQLHEEQLAAATSGWKLDDEAYAELKAHRAELDAVCGRDTWPDGGRAEAGVHRRATTRIRHQV